MMLITIENEQLKLTVNTLGAQMMSLYSGGIEYLWQGDPAYWKGRAPTLFPFIGRLTENCCKFHGKVYPMGIHGFAAASEFAVESQTGDRMVLRLQSSDRTRQQYPFDFALTVVYALRGDTVEVTYGVENRSNETMPFAVGGHPGFNVPLTAEERFEDYYLEFSQECRPDRVGFTPAVYLSGHDTAYPLADGKRISLHHGLFDSDAVILKNADREVTLRSGISGRGVRVTYPDMPYIGFWHMPGKDAPYVCIEPWSSLPSRQDVVEELTCKSDLVQLAPGKHYENTWSITVLKGEQYD